MGHKFFFYTVVGLMTMGGMASSMAGQTAQAGPTTFQDAQPAKAPKAKAGASNEPFDAHDLTGTWMMSRSAMQPPALSNNRPAFTPAGQAIFATAVTGFGNEALGAKGTPQAQGGNDPILICNPSGFPRILYFGGAMRIVQTPNDTMQFFERNHIWRDMWTDGRKLPAPEDAEPYWYGHSVGKWDGDTLVVNTVGFKDKNWLDRFGSPHSMGMTMEERYRRMDHDHIEMIITVTDPTIYTKPWVSDKKILNRTAADYDWREDLCVYSEEHSFIEHVMNPAGLGVQKK